MLGLSSSLLSRPGWKRLASFGVVCGALLCGIAVAHAPQLIHQDVNLSIRVPERSITVKARVTLNTSPSGTLRFLLNEALDVEQISVDGEALTFRTHDGWNPRNFWERPPYSELSHFDRVREIEVDDTGGVLSAGTTVEIRYSGVVADSLHAQDQSYGRTAEWTAGRIEARGAYLHGATFWIPWFGEDLFTARLTIDTPKTWHAVSVGDLATEGVNEERRWVTWDASRIPSEDLIVVAGPYVRRERFHVGESGRRLAVRAYTYADTDEDIVAPYLEATGPVVDEFSTLFGDYPFSHFALVENYWQTGLGMPGFTFLGDRVIRLPFIVHTSYPHEILHNWWGNGVYVLREQGNWCEGLTTYGADYMAKEREGEDAAREYRRSTLTRYRDFAVQGGRDFALTKFRERVSAATQAVGYGKTLMVFHMLRRELGDDTFYRSLRTLFREHRFRRAGWTDVRAAFERESGRDLSRWFREWVERPGAPILSLDDLDVTSTEDSGVQLAHFEVSGYLAQQEPTFDIEVPVVIRGSQGEVERQVVRSSGPSTRFSIRVSFEPVEVRADPGFDLFRQLHAEEVAPTLSRVFGAPRVQIVVGRRESSKMRAALEALAQEWAEAPEIEWIREGEKTKTQGSAIWFFGRGDLERSFSSNLPRKGSPETSWVASGVFQGKAAACFLPQSPETVRSVARKLTHYAKYSYLAFEGTTNVKKGTWSVASSPMVVSLAP